VTTNNQTQNWYLLKDDQRFGPVDEAAFYEFLEKGVIKRRDLVWRQGLETWTAAEQVPELIERARRLKPPPLPRHAPPIETRLVPPPLPQGFALSNSGQPGPLNRPDVSASVVAGAPNQATIGGLAERDQEFILNTQEAENGGYLTRHWRGQLALPISFWFNGFLGYLISTIAVALIGASSLLRTEFSPTLSLTSLIGAWTITFIVFVWQVVGTWRAATRYFNNAKKFWALAAKLSLCLASVLTAGQFVTRGAPQIREMYDIYLGDERVGKYAFRVLRDGAELEFSGGITFGASEEFKRFSEAMGALKIVHLNSVGGRIEEAQRIGDLIRERKLDTYVSGSCLSACTIVFLSGKNRFITQSAKIGFHQPDFPGLTSEDRILLVQKEEFRLQRLGLSAEFSRHATEAPPDDMWIPDPQRLIAEGVATRIVSSSSFGFSGINPAEITSEKTDALLRSIPTYAAIARINATAYQAILNRVLDGLRRGRSSEEMMVQVSPIVDELFERTLSQVPGRLLTEYTEMIVKHIRFLNRENPALCYAYLNPQKDDGKLLATIGSKYPTLLDDQNSIKAKVFGSYQFASDEGTTKDAVSGSIIEVLRSLERRFGKDVSLISKKEIDGSEYFSYCNVMAAFYADILRLPSSTRTGVLRTLFKS
jgi:hypothetical protein